MTARRTPDVVVIGAQKSASTYLADRLGQLPGVYVPELEVPYFEAPFFASSNPTELWRAGARAEAGDLFGIKRADYLAKPEVAGNLASVVPEAKLIAVLRPPVSRTVSAVYWYMLHGRIPLAGLNETLTQLLDAERRGELGGDAAEILNYSDYADALDRFRQHFPAEQLLVLAGSDVDTADTQRRVSDFLGLELGANGWPSDGGARANTGVYSPLRLRLLRLRAPLVHDWTKVDSFIYRPRPAYYRPVRTAIALVPKMVDRIVLSRLVDNEPETLSPLIRERLNERFANGLQRVAADYGVTFAPATEGAR